MAVLQRDHAPPVTSDLARSWERCIPKSLGHIKVQWLKVWDLGIQILWCSILYRCPCTTPCIHRCQTFTHRTRCKWCRWPSSSLSRSTRTITLQQQEKKRKEAKIVTVTKPINRISTKIIKTCSIPQTLCTITGNISSLATIYLLHMDNISTPTSAGLNTTLWCSLWDTKCHNSPLRPWIWTWTWINNRRCHTLW